MTECTHDLIEREMAVHSDGQCSICANTERDKLRELLNEYGRHSAGCSAEYAKKYGCRCGWDREMQALKEQDGKDKK